MPEDGTTAADVAFGAFIATLTPGRVKRERWVEPISVTVTRRYDRETEQALKRLRAAMTERKESAHVAR